VKNMRLIVGIISIVLVLLILFQSCAAGINNVMSGRGEMSGFSGFVFSILFLIAGIIGISTRKSEGNGGAITSIVFYTLAGVIGIANYGSFADLQIWSILSFIFAFLFILSIIIKKKEIAKNKTII
jgi:FtsH-binding integral membrane protein